MRNTFLLQSFALILLLNIRLLTLAAQEAPANPVPYTLHVYMNLIQVPALVLTEGLTTPPLIPINHFNISLDSGRKFHPTAMHIEGDDPITLAVLLDASGDQAGLLQNFSLDFAALAPNYLRPADHVSIFAVDCSLIRTLDNVPADPYAIRAGVTTALAAPELHTGGHGPTCAQTLSLRDSIVRIVASMQGTPGRRVLLAITDGHDGHSTENWAATQRYASIHDVAAFGIREVTGHAGSSVGYSANFPSGSFSGSDLDLFRTFCQANGGMVYPSSPTNLQERLETFVTMLRNRYIVEFPRPDHSTPGFHTINITVSGPDDFVALSSGVTFPTTDPVLPNQPGSLALPDTLPKKQSPATFGDRRSLTPPQ